MSDDSRPGGVRGRLRSPVGGGSKAGDPNVLMGAATPNRLSDQTVASKPVAVSTSTIASSPRPVTTAQTSPVGTQTASRPLPSPAGFEQPARRRLPALPTLIFLGFAALTGFRLINEFAQSFGPSEPTTPPGPATARLPGPITFGKGISDDCEVRGEGVTFGAGVQVYYLVELNTRQTRTSIVVSKVLFNHDVIFRDEWPPDGTGPWIATCGGPIPQDLIGNYRVEFWNEDETFLLAAGEYVVR